jgi:hypothetical protein
MLHSYVARWVTCCRSSGQFLGPKCPRPQEPARPELTQWSAVMQDEAGDREGAEDLYLQAADDSNVRALYRLAEMREEADE